MNVRISPTLGGDRRTDTYVSIIKIEVDAHGTLVLHANDGTRTAFPMEDYLRFSVDNDGAVS